MKKTILHLALLVLAVNVVFISNSKAATINAASCAQTDVQAAITKAKTDDTVIVPACAAITWTVPKSYIPAVSIPHNKKITLQGAGIGHTTISATANIALLHLNKSGSRITGFTFINGFVKTNGINWRIDHNRFEYDCSAEKIVRVGVIATGADSTDFVKGLIDNNQFHNMRSVTGGDPALIANTFWARPLGLGTDDAVYIENNTYTWDTCTVRQAVDSNYGGSYVFRYNTLIDPGRAGAIMAHAIQAVTGNRAARKWEIYNNRITTVGYSSIPGFLRAGTGVVFNNEVVGGRGYGNGQWGDPSFIMDEQRSCLDFSKTVEKNCSGASPWDGNTGVSGYPCRDQIGRSTDNPQWVSTPGREGAYTQALDPAYAWNNFIYPTEADRLNKTNGTAVKLVVKGDICAAAKAHLVEGRDFVNNGTTPKPGYTPYTYPHPLSGPEPARNLQIKN